MPTRPCAASVFSLFEMHFVVDLKFFIYSSILICVFLEVVPMPEQGLHNGCSGKSWFQKVFGLGGDSLHLKSDLTKTKTHDI